MRNTSSCRFSRRTILDNGINASGLRVDLFAHFRQHFLGSSSSKCSHLLSKATHESCSASKPNAYLLHCICSKSCWRRRPLLAAARMSSTSLPSTTKHDEAGRQAARCLVVAKVLHKSVPCPPLSRSPVNQEIPTKEKKAAIKCIMLLQSRPSSRCQTFRKALLLPPS